MSIFVSPKGERLKSHANRKCISTVLKVCTHLNPDACRKVLFFLPTTREARKTIQYLTPQEAQYFLDAMDDMSNSLTLRDRAIGKLAYYTGLRSCDIVLIARSRTIKSAFLPVWTMLNVRLRLYRAMGRGELNAVS